MAPQLNWGGEGYATYEGYCKVSKGEQQAAAAQAAASQAMANQAQAMTGLMNKQFAQQQAIFNSMLPQLKQMSTNPQGFGSKAMSAMTASMINTVGTQLASQQQGVRQAFATQNLAGLGSGPEQAILAQQGSAAAGAEASNLQQLSIANEQAKQQQQQFSLGMMGQQAGMMGSQGMGMGNLAMQGLSGAMQGAGQQFQMQSTMAQQGDFWSNFGTGVLGFLGTQTGGGFLSNTLGRIPGIGQFF